MRFLHLADLHIGKSLGEFHLIEDQKYILDQILGIARDCSADGVLIAGDVYDRPVPSEEAVKVFDHFIRSLADMGVQVFVISGNHDSDERLNFGSSLFEAKGVYICGKYNGSLYRREFEDEYGKIDVFLLPFVKASQVRHFFPDKKINSYEEAVRAILEETKMDPDRRNLLVAHQFVAGKERDPLLAGSESPGVKQVGLVERIGAGCFDGFDYVALGHIHSPQQVGREGIRYGGSPLKYSLSEAGSRKSVSVVTLEEKGSLDIRPVQLNPLRDLRHLKGTMRQLLDRAKPDASERDLIYATLTEEEPIDDVMGIFRQYYPNTVRIDYDNARTRELEQGEVPAAAEKQTFSELIGDFYRMIYGCGISEEEMAVMKDAAREAGVADETD